MIRFNAPEFTYPEAIRATGVDRKSIENWMTHGHIVPSLDASGRDRRFSLWDMLQIVVLQRLREPFNVQAGTAAYIAREVVNTYAHRADQDMAEIVKGTANGATDYRPTYGLARDDSGQLRAAERDDADGDTISIVLPVGNWARSLFAEAKILRAAQ
jgi:hypothetical protein